MVSGASLATRTAVTPPWRLPLFSLNQGKVTRSRTTLQISWDLTVRPNWSGSSKKWSKSVIAYFDAVLPTSSDITFKLTLNEKMMTFQGPAINGWSSIWNIWAYAWGGGTVKASTSIKRRTFWFFHSSSRQALPTFTEESLRWSQKKVSDSGWRQRQDGEGERGRWWGGWERLDPLWINLSCRLLRLVRLGWSQVC